MKRFKVVSIHFCSDCNLKCQMCYRAKKREGNPKPFSFFKELIPYVAELTDQVACLSKDDVLFTVENGCLKAKKINEIDSGTKILTPNGIEPTEIIKRETAEKMYNISCNGGRIIKLTENHLVKTKKGLAAVKELQIGTELERGTEIKIEEIDEINVAKELTRLGVKHRIENEKIIIERSKHRLPRTIAITPEFARLCGYFVSEGDKRGFSFHINEVEKHKQVMDAYKTIFPTIKITNRKQISTKSGARLEVSGQKCQILLFRKIMGFGYNARDKSIGKAFFFRKERIIDFLEGMYGGDGCLRVRKAGLSIEYKTASDTLAEELRILLEMRLGIVCSMQSGMNNKRKIGDRDLPTTTYRAITIYGKENMRSLIPKIKLLTRYAQFIDEYNKIGTKKFSNKKFLSKEIKIKQIIEVKKENTVYDIKLKNKPNLFISAGNLVVHNCGGGEPFLHPKEVMALGKTCKKNGLLMNVTTNGTQPMKPEYVKDIEMVSMSFDKYKQPRLKDIARYAGKANQLSKHTRVGVNFLIDSGMFKRKETLPMIVKWLFDNVGVERVFALYPKNWEFIDIIPHADLYAALTTLHDHFYIDDLTSMILTEKKYSGWKQSCHYGKDIISINEFGEVTGCSFDGPEKAILKLEKPEDILKIKDIKMEERHTCPYLEVKNE